MSNRNVRLGIVYRGSIVREEIIDRRIDVSVGLRADSTVQFAAKDYPDFPDHLDVLFCEAGKFYLVIPTDPSARVNLRGGGTNNVQQIRGKRCVPVEDIAGGSVVVGDVTVMFQFVKGYLQPSVTHERTVLRIGLVFDDRLISDRIFPEEKEVSVGGSTGDSLVLDQQDYSGPSIRFQNNKDGSVTLRTPKDVKVRVAVQDDAPRDLKELMTRGKAREEGADVVCHLTLGTRGRASLGPYTVLFQVIRQRVSVPQMDTKSVVQKFLGIFLNDVVWTACFSISFLLGMGVVAQALIYQHSTGQYLNQAKTEEQHMAQTYEVLVEEKPEPEPEEPEEEPKEQAPELKPTEAPKEDKKAKEKPDVAEKPAEKPQSTGETVDPTEKKKQVVEAVAKKTIAGALLGGGGAATKLFGEAGEGEEGSVVAKTFGGGGDAGEGEGPGTGGLKLAGGGGGGGTVEKVKTGKAGGFGKRDTSSTKVAAKKEEKAVKVALSAGALGGSGSNKGEIAKVIARKNSAVRRCYETALRSNPGLSGKVQVNFTVGTAGTVTNVNVMGASGEFADCIKTKFSRIRGLPLLPAPQSFNQSYVFTKS